MDNLIIKINHALNMGLNRFQWYSITGDEKHMIQSKEWIDIANSYMKEIIGEK